MSGSVPELPGRAWRRRRRGRRTSARRPTSRTRRTRARAAPHTAACVSYFAFEKAQNPACAACLTPFDYDFSELTGLTTCAAPFTDATCNHITACLVDCTDKSCAMCADPGALQQCQNQVPNSVCSSYYQDAQCIDNAFFGAGSFCDPNQGTGQFGDWLMPVGQYYCGGGLVGGFDGGFGGSSSSGGMGGGGAGSSSGSGG